MTFHNTENTRHRERTFKHEVHKHKFVLGRPYFHIRYNSVLNYIVSLYHYRTFLALMQVWGDKEPVMWTGQLSAVIMGKFKLLYTTLSNITQTSSMVTTSYPLCRICKFTQPCQYIIISWIHETYEILSVSDFVKASYHFRDLFVEVDSQALI